MNTTMTLDIESCGLNTMPGIDSVVYNNERDPRYDGLNRAQRRKAQSVERRALRRGKL